MALLAEAAAAGAGRRPGWTPAEIDTIVTVSTTGIATPALDARLMGSCRSARNVERLPVFGLGCAGGVLGLARAAAMAPPVPARACCCWWSSCAA